MSAIGKIFSGVNHALMKLVGQDTKAPSAPTPPPAAPTLDNTAPTSNADADEELQRRQLGGRSSTMLTGGAGLSSTGSVSSSSLLGS